MPSRHCAHRGEPPLVIHGFADAAVAAAALSKVFARGHVAIVADARGMVIDVLAFTDIDHTAEDAIVAGLDAHAADPTACRLVLVSILHDVDISTPNELEVDGWEKAVDRCRRKGVDLFEWICCSGEVLRVLSLTAKTQHAWRRG
ncbi:MAG: hypothetical protein QOJ69_1322 [Actinomycetota bacterium]|nr:hypothetical protein [Actinomycetota bacterium]